MKKILTVGQVTSDGIKHPKILNPFLCKGKYHEGCEKCRHSICDATVFERGVPSREIFAFLFEKPHSLPSIEKMRERMEMCLIPDCGSASFLSDDDTRRLKDEYDSLSDIEEKACFIVKLSLVGCDDLVSGDKLYSICNEINKLIFLQTAIVSILIHKHGAYCVNYSAEEHACLGCSVVGRHENKKQEYRVLSNGVINTHYLENKFQTKIPACLYLKF